MIRAEKAAPEGKQGAAIEFTVPNGQNFMLFKPKADKYSNIVQAQFWARVARLRVRISSVVACCMKAFCKVGPGFEFWVWHLYP
jgi:hypothetical protein